MNKKRAGKWGNGAMDMKGFKMDYRVYLHLLLYTRSLGAYRGVMKLGATRSTLPKIYSHVAFMYHYGV